MGLTGAGSGSVVNVIITDILVMKGNRFGHIDLYGKKYLVKYLREVLFVIGAITLVVLIQTTYF